MKIPNYVTTSFPRLSLVQAIGITLPNETPEKASSIGSEMVSENLAIRCSDALIQLLMGCIGYSYKEYKQTYALRKFSDSLRFNNQHVSQLNAYLQKGKQGKVIV